MGIVELLEESRPEFNQDFFNYVVFNNIGSKNETLKGSIGEGYVRYWLLGIEGLKVFSMSKIDYFDERFKFKLSKNKGIIIRNQRDGIEQEYDLIFRFDNRVYAVEVKSGKLNGVAQKLPGKINMLKNVYGNDFGDFLLFFPMYLNRQDDALRIENEHTLVKCIDIGYKKKQLDKICDLYRQRMSSSR